ncbi:MAG: hypothetical protein HFE57_06945 [Firmicutes bacterium]|jgi:RNase P subunit RPR2|nr:hypothetical protein [Bacillota bacterium]
MKYDLYDANGKLLKVLNSEILQASENYIDGLIDGMSDKNKIDIANSLFEMKWYTCPVCHNKLVKVADNFEARGIYIKCKKCKNQIEVKQNRARATEPEP